MIAPQELRLGNLVKINNSRAWPDLKDIPLTVIELSTEMDEYEKELFPKSKGTITLQGEKETYNQFSQFISPIELTEEWLLKFGFEKVNYTFWVKGLAVHNHDIVSFYMLYEQNRTYIKYVHQLQNLYHSLCGEELKINEI